jgi:hypothetical protein
MRQANAGLNTELVRDIWNRLRASEREFDLFSFAWVAAQFHNGLALAWLLGMFDPNQLDAFAQRVFEARLAGAAVALIDAGFDIGTCSQKAAEAMAKWVGASLLDHVEFTDPGAWAAALCVTPDDGIRGRLGARAPASAPAEFVRLALMAVEAAFGANRPCGPLVDAARAPLVDHLSRLCRSGASPDAAWQPLLRRVDLWVRRGLTNDEVAALLAGGFEDKLLERLTTELHIAVRAGLPARVKALLESGADPNERDLDRAVPLYYAKDAEIVALLRERTTGRTILGSSEYEEEDVVEMAFLLAALG